MMAVSAAISEQAASLGVSILIGGALFLLYDILRIFRRIVPHGNFWIGMEDFVYWINVMVFGAVFGLLGKIFGTILLPVRKHGKKIIHFFRKRLKKVCRAVKIGLCKL